MYVSKVTEMLQDTETYEMYKLKEKISHKGNCYYKFVGNACEVEGIGLYIQFKIQNITLQ